MVFLSAIASFAQVNVNNLQVHIKILANDSLEGRGTGTKGEKLALSYIQQQWKGMKLLPKGDAGSFAQKFPFKSGVHGIGREGNF